jgi:GST-like protein
MIRLYGHLNSQAPSSFKLRVALGEAGARYEYIPVDLAAGEQNRPAFLALNPHGKIPVLVDDGFALAESDAILWYVAEKFPEAQLLPRGGGGGAAGAVSAVDRAAVQGRARVLQWCDFVSTGIYQTFLDLYIHTRQGAPEQRVSWIGEAAAKKMERLLGVMDGILGQRSHLGGDFSIADIAAAAVLTLVKARIAPDPSAARAHIAAWYARVTARPAWRRALEDAAG